jgi:sulfhydrogenase subunit beta (sulfur reductase)
MKLTTHEELSSWLDSLAEALNLIAPRTVDGMPLYRPVQHSQEVLWDFTRPALSVKEAFFPATERLLTIEKGNGQIRLIESLPEETRVVFGVRPCDARGVKILDALFTAAPGDPYYARRRANTTLVGLACREMGPTCFCTSMGGSPDDDSNMDVMLYPIEEGYLVQAVTRKGQALLENYALQSRELSPGQAERKAAFVYEQAERYPLPERSAWTAQFEDAYWDQIAERCLSCRICAYVCPTCRCFDMRDEALSEARPNALPSGIGSSQFERIRCWDSCTGEAYRRIAGGHNPRAEKGQRLRNRFLCKFDYYPRQYALGTAACTGCGRCIDACPVNIDITEVMQHITEVSQC